LNKIKAFLCHSEFHKYLRPVEHPVLSEFCKSFTGITQESVDAGDLLVNVLHEFTQWLEETIKEKGLILPKTNASNPVGNCAFVSWTNFEFKTQLRKVNF
jgi:ERI1 exoribonuclease 2